MSSNLTVSGNGFNINRLSKLSGNRVLGSSSSSNIGIRYSTNTGNSWNNSNIINFRWSTDIFDTNAIAGSTVLGGGLIWSNDGGQNWNNSNGSNINNYWYEVAMSSSTTGVATSSSNQGIWYTSDGGQNWAATNINSGNFNSISFVGSIGIIGTNNSQGIYRSPDGGSSWNLTISPAISFISVKLDPTGSGVALAGTDSGNALSGLWRSINNGQNWNISISGQNWSGIFIYGEYAIAGGNSGQGIYWSNNGGQNFTQSNITSGNFSALALIGLEGIAADNNVSGIYYTINGGQNWTVTNITSGSFSSAILSSSKQAFVAGDISYYSSRFLCYEKNILILVLENENEVYKKVCELKVGDLIKTYKNGYKKIKIIKSFTNNFKDTHRIKNCLYKMKDHDVIVTGKHGFLYDKVTDEEIATVKKYGSSIRYIDDKVVLPAFASDKFERIVSDQEYELWHFALENEDINGNYGVYITDGILSESCSELHIRN